MKVVLKYIWSLAVLPLLIFLKGDLSIDTFLQMNHVEPVVLDRQELMDKLKQKPPNEMVLPVKIISQQPNFTGDGLEVEIYDADYTLIGKSQIIHHRLRLQLPAEMEKGDEIRLVVPHSADELTMQFNDVPADTLVVHEESVDNSLALDQ